MKNVKTVYLAGKITGDDYYFSKFYRAGQVLEEAGFVVINPANLPPEGFAYDAYIRMSAAMLDECEAVCFLPDWVDSKGAMYEYGRAVAKGKEIIFYDEWLAAYGSLRGYEGAMRKVAEFVKAHENAITVSADDIVKNAEIVRAGETTHA